MCEPVYPGVCMRGCYLLFTRSRTKSKPKAIRVVVQCACVNKDGLAMDRRTV
uniref:Uncharacterized protein n=1 Tax=Anopheles minimus TaxID=112268 RepID=A0A182VVI9_9DIPT